MPIRWLAPECIKDKIFTHQSDVWAFGVSVWELLTYGKCPYENCQDPQNLGQLLDKGERLPHPKYASLDVYMVMWRCWYNDPKARPSFHELSDTFAKYARDPGRYLAIPGDKLMKLPFYSPQDEHNLFKAQGVPIEGGPEKVVAAEDYLHLRSSDTPVPLTPCNKFIKDRGFDLEHGDDSPVPKYAPVTLLDQDNDFSAPDNDTVGDANNNSRLYERKKLDTLNVGATDIPGQYDNMDYHGSDAMSQNLSGILNKFQLDSNAMDASVPLTPCNKFIQDHDFDIDDDNYLLPSPGPHFNGYPHFSNGSRVFEWPEVCQSNVRTLDNLEYLLTANNYNYLNHNINNQPQLLPGNAVKPEEGQKRYRAKFRQICRNHQAIKLKDHNNLNNSEEMAQLTLHTGMSSLDSQMNTPLTPSCPNTPRLNLVTDVAPLRLSHSSSNSSQSFDEKMTYNSDDQTKGLRFIWSYFIMGDRTGMSRTDRTNGYEDSRGYMQAKKSKLADQNNEIREVLRNRHRSMKTDLFKGVSINVNGRTKPTADELKRLILLNGGEYHPYYRYRTTKFMIATNLAFAKIKQLRPDDRIVRPEWIMDSIAEGRLLPYKDYQIFAEEPRGKTSSDVRVPETNTQYSKHSSNTSNSRRSSNSDLPEKTKSRDIRSMFAQAANTTCKRSLSDTSISNPISLSREVDLIECQDARTETSTHSQLERVNSALLSETSNCSIDQKTNVDSVGNSSKIKANLCGTDKLNTILDLIKEWIGCPEGITDEDTACVINFFFDMMSEKNFHTRLYMIVETFRERVVEYGQCEWVDLFNNIIGCVKVELNSGDEQSKNLSETLCLIE
ncbi:Epidermal growth factor receptor [Fragariocoptes setiger]|uniref:Epidermal growth factor receptor n=1 Tax=Fragariocoptes setiger TaxID=1670756 RepID=A0ABQ7SBC1_9ACAR|nr:Epidermal growth factor receptor [Fragariocoptes setiger]